MALERQLRKNLAVVREFQVDQTFPLVEGLVATDGVLYSSVATFGTTAVSIFSKTIDPGFDIDLKGLDVGLTQKFTGLNGSYVASMMYYWTFQSQYYDTVAGVPTLKSGTSINVMGTYQKAVGTLASSEDTFSGFVPIGSIPKAPVIVTLKAVGIQSAVCTGQVKNSSYVRFVGHVVPGT